jgi:PD-(D/E)XK nuclease superfamily
MSCPLAAHYRYHEGLPRRLSGKALFGSTIHSALELFNTTGDYERTVEKFKHDWANPISEPDYWPRGSNYADLRKRGLEILEKVKNHYRFQDRRVIGCEIPFLVPYGDHELTGFVDLVETQRSGTGKEVLKIVDYKTNAKDPWKNELALDVQFTVYHYAVSQKEFWVGAKGNPDFPGVPNGEWLWETLAQAVPKRCIWFSLWSGKQLDAGPRTDADYQRLYRVCDEIQRATEAEIFVPKVGEACNWCDFTEQCAMEIPVSIKSLEDVEDDERWI